jgi:DNA polymerase III alpha subunit (gram-positive type)
MNGFKKTYGEDFTEIINIRITKELKEKIEQYADDNNILFFSIAARELIEKGLKKDE